MSAGASFIIVENVSKEYRADSSSAPTTVLTGINLSIGEGEFVALMGPSGSGKTTLLTIMGAMNSPSAGRILVDGISVYDLREERLADFRREYLGFVFQQHLLMPYLTALENVMLPLAVKNVSVREKRERGLDVLEKVGLIDKTRRLPSQLSGGEQGRLAIARAIVNEPPLLLADEPTGTLDSRTGAEIMGVFSRLNAQGQTILLVTHNPDNAALTDRTINIRDGRVVGDGSAQEKGPSEQNLILACDEAVSHAAGLPNRSFSRGILLAGDVASHHLHAQLNIFKSKPGALPRFLNTFLRIAKFIS